MTVKMILATDEKGAIGINEKLPWNCPEDLQYFKNLTTGSAVIMGRKTFDGLPFKKGLPNRYNYVITSGRWEEWGDGQFIDMQSIIDMCDDPEYGKGIAYVIGGKSVYEQLLPYIDEIHHTTIAGEYEADTFMDMSFLKGWVCEEIHRLSEMAVVKVYKRRV